MANGCTELMEGSHKWSDEQITTSVSGIDEVQTDRPHLGARSVTNIVSCGPASRRISCCRFHVNV